MAAPSVQDLKGKVDFAILTIREDEFAAVLKRIPTETHCQGRRGYAIAHLQPSSGDAYTVAMLRCPEQGTSTAQAVTTDVLEDLNPRWLLLVGIAGGVPEFEFTLGDVVVATRLLDFSIEATLEGKPPEYAVGGGPMHRKVQNLAAQLPAMTKELEGWNSETSIGPSRPPVELRPAKFYGDKEWKKDVRERLEAHFGPSGSWKHPKVTAAPVASSDRLLKSATTLKAWQKSARHIRAIEMELAGVYQAARRHDREVPILAIRGISDIVCFKRHYKWTAYACETAAAFAFALLKSGLIALPEPSVEEHPTKRSPAIHQIPPSPADFVGRTDELARLQAAAEHGGVLISGTPPKGVAGFGLHGMAGVGKTALALKLAEGLKAKYPDAQFYLDLLGVSPEPLTPADAMAHIVHGYLPEAKLPEKEAELRGLYLSVLDGQRALLLMDNARDAAQVEPLIPPASCLLLVTSRQHFALPGLHAEDLDALPADDARALLLEIAPRIGEHADELARLCGRLPLALRLTAKALAERKDLAVPELLRRLDDAQQRLCLTGAAAALRTSYDLLSPDQQCFWRALAVFPGGFDLPAAAAVWALGPDPAQDALSELLRFSLLEFTPAPQGEEARGRYRLHDLARDFASSRLADPERASAQQLHAAHYKNLLAVADDLYMEGGDRFLRGLRLFDLERANIEAGQAWAAAHAAEDPQAAKLADDYPNAGTYVISLRLHPSDLIRWREAALAAARGRKDRSAEGAHLGNLGCAYAALGETRKAIECHEKFLAIAREIGDRRGEGQDLGNLGIAYAALGETRRAIECHEKCLAIVREIGDRRGEGAAVGSLGNAYAVLGETQLAVDQYEQALAIAREIGDRRAEGNSIGNLGVAFSALGETRKAIEFHEQHLAIAREIGDRQGEAIASWNQGLAYEEQGDLGRAVALMQVRVDYLRELGHSDAEKRAAHVEALRGRMGKK